MTLFKKFKLKSDSRNELFSNTNEAFSGEEFASTMSSVNLSKRSHCDQEQFNNDLLYSKPTVNVWETVASKLCDQSPGECIMRTFPVIRICKEYVWKEDFPCDLISGVTVAIMHIPQGMAYALLGNVPPIVGIYMAFFPVLLYFIFGTSRHNSMGTFAVISIMVGKIVLKFLHSPLNDADGTTDELITVQKAMEIATTVCFIVGCIQLIMYILRLGVISSLLSETLVSGFTTGAAIHVFTSQIKDVLGLSIPPQTGHFSVINTYIEIFRKITNANIAAIVISIISIIILVVNNEWLKPKLAKKISIPFPIEFIAIIVGTLTSQYMNLNERWEIKSIGHIPTGLPFPKAPNFSLWDELIVDCFTIAMVSYTVSVSMGLIFAQKYNYEIDFNQEFLAIGAGNVFGSFFSCMPFSASLSRSMIQANVGGKTQIASVISCGILAAVLLWIGPFFEPLPRCVLASIILVALKGMLMQITQLFAFWKLSCLDGFVWLATFLTVVIVDIDIGLVVGIACGLACIFIRGLKPYICLLGHVPKSELYLDISRYKMAEEIPDLKIFHYCGNINFASRNYFKSAFCETLQIDIALETRKKMAAEKKILKYNGVNFKSVIFDFTALSYIDSSGASTLKTLIKELNSLSISVCLSGCPCPVYEVLQTFGLLENQRDDFKVFPSVHDAVNYCIELNMPVDVVSVRL